MGIDIGAKLIYGCNYSDLPEEILEEVDEMLDDGDLDTQVLIMMLLGMSGLLGLRWSAMEILTLNLIGWTLKVMKG